MMIDFELVKSRINKDYVSNLVVPEIDETIGYRYCILGPSGCGKDTAAGFLAMNFDLVYDGPSSLFLCSLLYPENVKEFYVNRHQYKQQLYEFGNIIRADDPLKIARAVAKDSNILVGLRGWADIDRAMESDLIDFIIWIHCLDAKPDPTLDIDLSELLRRYGGRTYIVNNEYGYINNFYTDLAGLFDRFGIERRLNMSPSFEKYGVKYLETR